MISIGSAYLKTVYGQKVTIECNVTADPPVTFVFWRRNTNNIVSTLNEGTVGTNGISITMPSLVITYPTTEDSGSYTCYASNRVGTQQSLPVILSVEGGIFFVLEILNSSIKNTFKFRKRLQNYDAYKSNASSELYAFDRVIFGKIEVYSKKSIFYL